MKKIIVLIISVLILFLINGKTKENEIIIPNEAIRFRVIANSNTIYDQNIKIQIKNLIQNELLNIIKDSSNINDTRNTILEHKEELYELANNKLKELNYDKELVMNYGYNYFPEKKYKGVTYKEGKYESLVITIGDGEGDNFWCVLFPPLCLLETNDSNMEDIEYSFYIKNVISKYFN